MKIKLSADMIVPGDKLVHPQDLQPRVVKSVQRSFGHMDYLDLGFEDGTWISVWKITHLTVVR